MTKTTRQSFSNAANCYVEAPPVIAYGYAAKNAAERMAESTGFELVSIESIQHPGDEIEQRLHSNVHDRSVIYIASPSGNPNKQLFETQAAIETIHDAGARHIIGMFPYMWYNRGDKKEGIRRPITAAIAIKNVREYLTHAIVAAPHNADITYQEFRQNRSLKRCETPNFAYIYGRQLRHFYEQGILDPEKTVFANIDSGAGKRNHSAFKKGLLGGLGPYAEIILKDNDPESWIWVNLEKIRNRQTNKTTGSGPDTTVEGMDVFAVEDLISSGRTGNEAAEKIMAAGARSANLIAAHGLYTQKKGQRKTAAIDGIDNSALSLILTANTYDHSLIDPKIQAAIDESPVIHEMDIFAYLGLYAEVLSTTASAELVAEALETGLDSTSISAIDIGEHPALTERPIFTPIDLKSNNPLLLIKGQKEKNCTPKPEA